ncbi:MAG: TetR/AcrR family transcriptional regulator [Proteobacteria bacterium]|jgi:AcrR family transcriptional regulator|nr:TetR/AcrR family transcriptional regulator [Pseudomonadota bacterium]
MRCKSETKRQTIIEVAREVFEEHGFGGTSMSEIAARVGGSKATLYSYFASKEELFVAVVRSFAETHLNEVFNALDATADLTLGLCAFGERFLSVIYRIDTVRAYRNLFVEAGNSPVGRMFYERGPQEGLTEVAAFLRHAMALGKLREADPMLAAQHFLALLKAEGFERITLCVIEYLGPDEIAPMVARAVDVFLRAYAPET